MLVFLVLEALVDRLEFFLAGFQTVASEPFVLGGVRWVFDPLRLENGLFLLEAKRGHGKGLDNGAPLLAYSHLVSLQVVIGIVLPVEEDLLLVLGVSEAHEFALEDDYPVLLLLGDLGDEGIDVGEHLGVEFSPKLFRRVRIYGCVHEIELLFKDAVRTLLSQRSCDHLYEFMRGHFGIFDHFEEASPDEGAAQDVLNVVHVLYEEFQRNWVDHILGERVVLEVQQHRLVVVRAIVVGGYFGLRQHEHLQHIHLAVLLE